MKHLEMIIVIAVVVLFNAMTVYSADNSMGFFVTSVGSGKGGDLGGLEGADAHCQALATAVGAGKRQWRAYLSTEEDGKRGISARERIGNGPWYNAKGVLIAENLTELHLYNKTITKETALDEKGGMVNGRGDTPLLHDILTGTMDDSLSMAMIACTGSEANEIALRMARQHTGAQGIIVTNCGYHGNTEAVAELGLAEAENVNYPTAIKRVIGMAPLPEQAYYRAF